METKQCSKCKEVKGIDQFYFVISKNKPQSSCKPCSLATARKSNLKKRNSRPKVVIEDLVGEIWVPVKGFEDKYVVSNLGRVKSNARWVFRKIVGKEVFMEGKLLAQTTSENGYYPSVTLYGATQKDKFPTPVYHIVFFSFNPEIEKIEGYEIDHIDQDRGNSKLNNLQYITSRANSTKRSLHKKGTSKYAGVSMDKARKRWQAHIRANGGNYCLGIFKTEEEAAQAYQVALKRVNQGLHPRTKPARTSGFAQSNKAKSATLPIFPDYPPHTS